MTEPAIAIKELITLGFVLPVIALSAIICRYLKISPFLGYLFIGIALQAFLNEQLSFVILSKIGIVLLFFHIGSTVSWKGIANSSRNLLFVAIDFLFNFMIPFTVLILFKRTMLEAAVISAILYPTSSVVTISNLIQQRRSGYPETEMIVWMLIGEDIVIVILLAIMMQLGFKSVSQNLLGSIGFISIMMIMVFFFSRQIQHLYSRIPKEDRAVFLFGLAFALGVVAYKLGFSEALGAFLFGMLFSGMRGVEDVERHLVFLRELGVAFFFLLFGLNASFTLNTKTVVLAFLLLFFSVASKWWTGVIGGKLAGLGKGAQRRLAFSLWTRGEFSMLFLWVFSGALSAFWVEALRLFLISSLFLGLIGFLMSSKKV